MLKDRICAFFTRHTARREAPVRVAAWAWVGARLAAVAAFVRRSAEKVHSQRLREGLAAVGAFAALALFAAASLDYLVSGGPDWNPSAQAAPYLSADRYVTLSSLPEIAYAPPQPSPEPTLAVEEAQPPRVYPSTTEELLGGPIDGAAIGVEDAALANERLKRGAPLAQVEPALAKPKAF